MPRVVLTALFLVLFLRSLFLCPSIRFSITFSLSSLFYFSFSFLSHSSFLSLFLSFSFSHSTFRSRRFSSGKSFGFRRQQRRSATFTFSPTHPTLFSLSSSLSLSLSFSHSSASSRAFASPRYLVGHVLLPVFLLHPFSQASLI